MKKRAISTLLFLSILFTSIFGISGVAEAVTKEIETVGAAIQADTETVGATVKSDSVGVRGTDTGNGKMILRYHKGDGSIKGAGSTTISGNYYEEEVYRDPDRTKGGVKLLKFSGNGKFVITPPSGKKFVGWRAKRDEDSCYRYKSAVDGSTTTWATSRPTNYYWDLYKDQETIYSTVGKNKVVYFTAIFADATYTVSYDANGGSGSMASEPFNYNSTNSVGRCLRKNTFTRSKYTFRGWYSSRVYNGVTQWKYMKINGKTAATASASKEWYEPGKQPAGYAVQLFEDMYFATGMSTVDGSNVTMHAQWAPVTTKTKTYYIEFNANGGTGAQMPMSKIIYSNATPPKSTRTYTCTYTKPGYYCDGWYCNRSRDDKWRFTGNGDNGSSFMLYDDGVARKYSLFKYTNGGTVHATSSVDCDVVTFYAVWKPIVTYTINFDPNGGIGTMTSQTATAGQNYTLPNNLYTRPGYTFWGWTVHNETRGLTLYTSTSGTRSYVYANECPENYAWYVNNPGTVIPAPGQAQDVVTVRAWWTEITKYTVHYGSTNPTMGTVTHNRSGLTSGGTVETGTQVTFTANALPGYKFTGWSASGISLPSLTSPTVTATITANTYIYANFEVDPGQLQQGMYLVYNPVSGTSAQHPSNMTSNKQFTSMSDGRYYVKLSKNAGDFTTGAWCDFAYSTTTYYSTMGLQDATTSVNTTAADGYLDVSMVVYSTSYGYLRFPRFKAINKNITGVSIIIDLNAKTYTVVPEIDVTSSDYCVVYAKNGTVRDNYTKYGDMADTTVINGLVTDAEEHTYYDKGYAEKGSTITIQTTIKDEYKDKYYVKGFCINGESYGVTNASAAAENDGVFTVDYTLDTSVTALEITPVYYYFIEEDTITLYADSFDLVNKAQWGNTLAAYATYKGGVDSVSGFSYSRNELGGYPGQPMIYEGGRYTMQVPKYLNFNPSYPLTKISMNNYVRDTIHSTIYGSLSNCELYDADDAVTISNRTDTDNNIVFQFKPRTGTANTTIPSTFNASNYANGFEVYKSFSGNNIDLFGNVASGSSYLHIVSHGYNYNPLLDTYNGVLWTIYAPDNTLIGTVPSSICSCEFADDVDSRYSDIFDKLYLYETYPVQITYDSIRAGSDGTYRYDGRWFFTGKGDTIASNLRIAYANNLSSAFTNDTLSGTTGSTTQGRVYFTNAGFNGSVSSGSVNINPKNHFTFTAEERSSDYMFAGWYLFKDNKYTKMSSSKTATAPMISSDIYVALYIRTPRGIVNIHHKNYKDMSYVSGIGTQHGGSADCTVKVEIVNKANGSVVATLSGNNSTDINIGEQYIRADSNNVIRITLYTKLKGLNTFAGCYLNFDGSSAYKRVDYDEFDVKTRTIKSVITYDIRDLYLNDGTAIDTKSITNINYYSNVIPVERQYAFTYKYTDRFGNTNQKYVNAGVLTEDNLDKYIDFDDEGNPVVKKTLLGDFAPYQQIFNQNISWNLNASVEISSIKSEFYRVEISATQQTTSCVVKYSTSTSLAKSYDVMNVQYGTLLCGEGVDENGDPNYLLVAEKVNPLNPSERFSHWEITDDDGKLIAKCYYYKFNYLVYESCYITPIYSVTPESFTSSGETASVQFLGYSRHQATSDDGLTVTDKIYADFSATFTMNGSLIDTTKNRCGLILAVSTENIPQTDTGLYNGDITGKTFYTDEDKLRAYILNGTKYTADSGTKGLINYQIKSLNNKNRVEIYQGFANKLSNVLPIIKVYAYMVTDNGVVLSEPVYINLYNTSVQTY